MIELEAASVEAVATRVVELLREDMPTNGRPLSTAEVARRLGRSRDFVYSHRAELGGVPLGPVGGDRKPRLGFDPERVEAFVRGGESVLESPKRTRPKRRHRPSHPDLLPVRPSSGPRRAEGQGE